MAVEVKKGDIIEIDLDNLAHGGECVGHLGRLAIFVQGGIPGERVRVKINMSKKNFARGEILEVLSAAQGRVEPACPVYADCGGCQLQHIDYQLQLRLKREMTEDLLQRVGKLNEIMVKPVIGSDYPLRYRNKAQFPLTVDKNGKIAAGFFRQGTHEVVVQKDCSLQHPLINRILRETLSILNKYQLTVYREKNNQGLLRHLVIRTGVCTNQSLLVIVTGESSFPDREEIATQLMQRIPELKGVLHNINPDSTNVILGKKTEILKGQDFYLDYIANIKYAISYSSFFQVNTLQTEILYNVIRQNAALTGQEVVLDAYCGIGSIAIYLAKMANRVLGIEEYAKAIEDANRNACLNNIGNSTFITGRVEDIYPELVKQGIIIDLLILDPPRKGLSGNVIETILENKPERLIYVSCNPATLARDLAILQNEYIISTIQPVDMFPQTYHVETIVALYKKD
jgi:23S rRNA (uracil1939-C5)-methyltransferase